MAYVLCIWQASINCDILEEATSGKAIGLRAERAHIIENWLTNWKTVTSLCISNKRKLANRLLVSQGTIYHRHLRIFRGKALCYWITKYRVSYSLSHWTWELLLESTLTARVGFDNGHVFTINKFLVLRAAYKTGPFCCMWICVFKPFSWWCVREHVDKTVGDELQTVGQLTADVASPWNGVSSSTSKNRLYTQHLFTLFLTPFCLTPLVSVHYLLICTISFFF